MKNFKSKLKSGFLGVCLLLAVATGISVLTAGSYIVGTTTLTTAQKNALSPIYPLQTGQTTSYGNYDDGYYSATNGRLVNFFTLSSNNSFGNTNRFTDELGGQTYASNYIVDNATGLGWCRTEQSSVVWDTARARAHSFTLSTGIGTLSGFHLPNIAEYQTILNYQNSSGICLGYAPFNLSGTSQTRWTSTTVQGNTTTALRTTLTASIASATGSGKTNANPYFVCRIHFQ